MTTGLTTCRRDTNLADVVTDIIGIAMATRSRSADRIAARVTRVNVTAA